MSKKGDGKNKGGKNNNPAAKVAKPKADKPPKVKGPKPASYKPAAKMSETLQTPQAIWGGHHGLMDVEGTIIRSSEKTLGDGARPFNVYHVVKVPVWSGLADLAGSDIYITEAQLHLHTFSSKFEEGSKMYKVQYRIWKYLRKFFMDLGIGQNIAPNPATKKSTHQKPTRKTSASVADFITGKQGMYCFEEDSSPQVVILLTSEVRAPQFGSGGNATLVAELVSVDDGHLLAGSVRVKTFVYHNKIRYVMAPHFSGARAGDAQKLWQYLHDIVAKHQTEVAGKILKPVPSSQGAVIGERVISKADRRILKAA